MKAAVFYPVFLSDSQSRCLLSSEKDDLNRLIHLVRKNGHSVFAVYLFVLHSGSESIFPDLLKKDAKRGLFEYIYFYDGEGRMQVTKL